MRKRALLAFLAAAALLLSGCSLVVKDPVVDARQVIIDVNGETVDKQTFMASYNQALNYEYYMQQMYQQYGLVQSISLDEDKVLKDTLDSTVRRKVLLQKAKEAGLDALTEDEKAEIQADVRTQYQENLDEVKEYYFADTPLEGDELDEAVKKKAAEAGVTETSVEQQVTEALLLEKVEAYATGDIVVSEEEVREEYDSRVADAKAQYDETPNAYGEDLNGGGEAYYAPAGYRFVKQVLIKFLPEDQELIDGFGAQLDEANRELSEAAGLKSDNDAALAAEGITQEDSAALSAKAEELARQAADAQAKVDGINGELRKAKEAAYAKILPKAQEIAGRAQAGESFDALAAEFNEDTGMPARGYAVRKGFSSFDDAFVLPAMALEKPGDVSDPSAGVYGYYIVQFSEEIPEGPAAFEAVSGGIGGELLAQKKEEAFEAAAVQWIAEAKVSTYPERVTQD